MRKLFGTALALALLGSAVGLSACGGDNNGGGGGTGGTGGGGTGGTGGGGGSGGTGGTGGGGGGGGMANLKCSSGTLFAGNPTYDGQPSDRPTSGTGIHADPPFQWTNMIFNGNTLYSRDEGEVWMVDLSAASPVETRIAGQNDAAAFAFTDGPCATARFAQIRGMDVLPDGSLVVADQSANAILHITNPTTAGTCAVEYWAGNNTPNTDIDPENPPDNGDMDGDGAAAKLSNPRALIVDANGDVVFFDAGNHKIKKVGAAAPHTVTTLATLGANDPDKILNWTRIGNTIYGAGMTPTSAGVISVSSTGTIAHVLFGDGSLFPPLDSHSSFDLGGITTDGTGLYVAGSGYLWYLTTSGQLSLAAGIGFMIDFPPDASYDPAAPHSADTLDLYDSLGSDEATTGSFYYLTYKDGSVYFRGHGDGTAAFIEKIACP
ncbi:MAG TPA: hypothetical protein VN947_22380 [Polyangia bacterium]|nr:hypothetical protein [Polyangia bacterium]